MEYFYRRIAKLLFFFMLSMACYGQVSISNEIKTLTEQLVPDKRVAILDISLNDTLNPSIIKGETNLPNAKEAILRLLTEKGYTVTDSIQLLPNESVGKKTWALANLSVSNIRALPDHASELVSQVVMGTPLKILDYREKWYRVQTPELYIGWIDSSGLHPISTENFNYWRKSERCHFNSLNGFAYAEANVKSNVVSDLVLGNLFEVEKTEKGFLKIKMPDGRLAYVQKKHCISFKEWYNIEADGQSVLKVPMLMMGTPYLWGGTSSKGVDCSGFVKMAFYAQGIIITRDASQQALYGEIIDFSNPRELQKADLLFFGNSIKKITHVGLYVENGDFIHSSGKVHISSIDPKSKNHNPTRNLVLARRVLNSPNTNGIIKVKDHPWYQ